MIIRYGTPTAVTSPNPVPVSHSTALVASAAGAPSTAGPNWTAPAPTVMKAIATAP